MRRVRVVGDVCDGVERIVGGGKLEETSLTPARSNTSRFSQNCQILWTKAFGVQTVDTHLLTVGTSV